MNLRNIIFLSLALVVTCSFMQATTSKQNSQSGLIGYWQRNKEYINDGALMGAILSLPLWAGLVIKDHYRGIVMPGGPVFHGLQGLPVVTALSAIAFASLENYYKTTIVSDCIDIIRDDYFS